MNNDGTEEEGYLDLVNTTNIPMKTFYEKDLVPSTAQHDGYLTSLPVHDNIRYKEANIPSTVYNTTTTGDSHVYDYVDGLATANP